MSTRIPPLLEPYLSLPPETSLIVMTSVLGASTNWLVLRYLHTLLNPPKSHHTSSSDDDNEPISVLLVSFLRDYAFWRDSASRVGVDLESAGRRGKFGFVDGLGMFLSPSSAAEGSRAEAAPWRTGLRGHRLEDVRRTLDGAVEGLRVKGGKVVLVIDQLDLLPATAGEMEEGEDGFGERLRDVLLELREVRRRFATY
jgi:elongator complex protein 6